MYFLKSIINKYINTSPQNAPDVIYKIKKKQLQNAKGLHNHFITTFLIVCGGTA